MSLRNWLVSHGYVVTIVGRKLFGVEIIRQGDVRHVESGPKVTRPRTLDLPRPIYTFCMLVTSLFFLLEVVRVSRTRRISLIHAQDTGYGGLSAILSAKVLGVPVVISSHGVRYLTLSRTAKGISRKLSLLFEYWLDVVTSRRADLIIVVSSSVEDFFANLGIQRDAMRMIPTGIEWSSFQASEEARDTLRRELHLVDDIVVGFVGRLSVEKNLFTLLESFARACRYADRTRLMLVGTGPVEGRLRILSRNRGIDGKIILTGIRYDINRLLSALDIFVLPSYTEGCPMALLEAMASGRAIIASGIPSIRQIVRHAEEAILVNPNDAEELKRAILLLYGHPELRIELGRKAQERARLYDIDRTYGLILTVYEELVRCKENQDDAVKKFP